MMTLKYKDKTYMLRFNYRVLGRTDIVDKIIKLGNTDDQADNTISTIIETTAEMLLAALQKYHKDEFGFITNEQKEEKMNLIYDMLDDLEDEGTNAYSLFEMLSNELSSNGFLSQMSKMGEESEEKSQTKTKKQTK